MGHKDRLPEGKRTAADGPKGDSADSMLPVALGTDLAPIDRLRQHLAFGDTELAPCAVSARIESSTETWSSRCSNSSSRSPGWASDGAPSSTQD